MPSTVSSVSVETRKWLCLEFTNTVENYRLAQPLDGLTDFGSWVDWSRRHGVVSHDLADVLVQWSADHTPESEASLTEAKELRWRLFQLLSARAAGSSPTESQLDFLNGRLAASLLRLNVATVNQEMIWQWQEAGTPEDLLRPIVYSAAQLLTHPQCTQLRQCGGDKCTWLFIDESKNQSRRWCDMKICGNRAKSRRHYQRQRHLAS